MKEVITPWMVIICALGLLLLFASVFVAAYEETTNKKTWWSKIATWLCLHAFETILLAVSSAFAVGRLEQGRSLAAVAECFLFAAVPIAGGILWRLVRRRKEVAAK